MLDSYLPLLILLALSVVNAVVMVGLSTVVSPTKWTKVKSSPTSRGWTRWGARASASR